MNLRKLLKIRYGRIRQWIFGGRYRRESFKTCGPKVLIHDGTTIYNPENVSFDSEIYIGPGCTLFGHGGITFGRGVVLGESVRVLASNHRYDAPDQQMLPFDSAHVVAPVLIGDYVWVGSYSIILPGVQLAPYSVIGAGSVVTKNTEPFGIYAGNPARLLKYRNNQNLADITRTWVGAKADNEFFLD